MNWTCHNPAPSCNNRRVPGQSTDISLRARAFLGRRRATVVLWLKWLTYALATAQVVRFYFSTTSGVHLDRYLQGTDLLPYQKRYLPAILIRAVLAVSPVNQFLQRHHTALSSPEHRVSMLLSGISLAVAGCFCVRLYRAVSPQRRLGLLVYPLFLVLTLLSYAVHIEQNLHLPYDFPSLAFFSAGLYVIYTRQYLWLLGIMLLGTLNRETTIFLIPIFVLDCVSGDRQQDGSTLLRSFEWARFPWLRTLLLLLAWIAVEVPLSRHFANNDRSEVYLRFHENLHRLKPTALPVLLDLGGYLLPFVLVMFPLIRPRRFGNYALVAIPWIVIMLWYGVITETRIFGELVPYVTISSVLLLEQYLTEPRPGVGSFANR